MSNNSINLEYRVTQLETDVGTVAQEMYTLRTNDLPHIMQELITVKTTMGVLSAVNVAAIILAVVATRMFSSRKNSR